MKKRNLVAMLLVAAMTVSALTGCGSGKDNQGTSGNAGNAGNTQESQDDIVDVEIWNTNRGFLDVQKGSELYNFYVDLIGVGLTQPYVEWNGGETYLEQLNLRIAANEMPDIFQPVNGMELELAESGALLDLTDLLPEKAPHLWETVPEEVWDVMRSYDPNGEGRIYFLPQLVGFARNGALIRQDWLDKLGLEMPTTQEEFVEVLRAFKTQDPNGNGIADELPTGGRAEARWMDYLFSMYEIAMWEGYPQWDIYDGELTYSAVTPNMKEALQWIAELYAEGLLDPETLLNDKATWDGKINSNLVGVYFQWAQATYEYATAIEKSSGVQADIKIVPPISAEGYEGYYTMLQVSGVQYVVKNTDDQKKIDAVMKVLDAYGNMDLWDDFYHGVPGMHCVEENGKYVNLPEDMKTQQNILLQPYNYMSYIEPTTTLLEDSKSAETAWAYDDSIENLSHMVEYGKRIAGDGMPTSVYDGYADIKNRTLWAEYASKIISGEYSIDKFDEFVEKWYATGGDKVTEAARAWYATTQQ